MRRATSTIQEEGVYIDDVKLVEGGRFREAEILRLLQSGPWPARNPVQNLNDLKAQVAANQKGAEQLRAAVAEFGLEVVQAYMGHVQDNAAASVRRMLKSLPAESSFAYEIDQGSVIRVKVSVDADAGEAVVDFTGTSPQRPDNFNAPLPVTRAAVLYALRVMVEDERMAQSMRSRNLRVRETPSPAFQRPRPPEPRRMWKSSSTTGKRASSTSGSVSRELVMCTCTASAPSNPGPAGAPEAMVS